MADEKKEKPLHSLGMEDMMAKIEAKYGKGSILRADKARVLQSIPRIPTEIFAVDLASWGGIPIGRISMFFGPFSSFKTGLALKVVKGSQRMCKDCMSHEGFPRIYVEHSTNADEIGAIADEKEQADRPLNEDINEDTGEVLYSEKRVWWCEECQKETLGFQAVWMDAEGSWANDWSQKMGVWIDWLYIIRTEYAEQAIDIADAMLRSGQMDLLVIDSIAALTPRDEIESSVDDWQMGLAARLVNKACRKFVSSLNAPGCLATRRPTIILINQIREKIGVMFGNPETKPGGKGQEFAASLELRMTKGKYKFESGQEKQKGPEDRPLYAMFAFKVTKSRVCPARMEGGFDLWVNNSEEEGRKAGDIDDSKMVLALAKKYGIIEKDKSNWTYNHGEITHKTQGAVISELMADKTKVAALKRKLVLRMKG